MPVQGYYSDRLLDNEAALAVTIVENLQRVELHPLEEAETIQQAIEREYNLKAVAAKVGNRHVFCFRPH